MEVTDNKGRKFSVKELDPGDMLDLYEAAGRNSGNVAWVRMAMIIASVTAIDGVPVPLCRTPQDVVLLAKQVGNDGLAALTRELFGDDKKKIVPTTDEVAETAKN